MPATFQVLNSHKHNTDTEYFHQHGKLYQTALIKSEKETRPNPKPEKL